MRTGAPPGPLVVSFDLGERRRAIIAEALGGAAETVYLSDIDAICLCPDAGRAPSAVREHPRETSRRESVVEQDLDFQPLARRRIPVERQVRADPGRLAQRPRLLLGPAHEIVFINSRGVAGHFFSSRRQPIGNMIAATWQINLSRKDAKGWLRARPQRSPGSEAGSLRRAASTRRIARTMP